MSGTFVLITGAWHGGWSWRPVAVRLRAAGHRVFAPTLPGLHDDDDPTAYRLEDVIDSIVELVEVNDLRDVTMVAHSWGGYPSSGAAPRIASRLSKMIYVSAFVPAEGRSLMDEAPPQYRDLFMSLASESVNNAVLPPFEIWQGAFMQDASEDAQRIVYNLLIPQPMQYFTEPVAPIDPASLGVPAVYLHGTEDISLPPGYGYERFAERLGVQPTAVPGSHESLFTRSAELAEAVLKA